MGNRDKRGREKKKPKKKETKQTLTPAKLVPEYKPAALAQHDQANTAPAKVP